MGNRLCSCGNREDATNKEEADLNTKHMKNEEEEMNDNSEVIEKAKAINKKQLSLNNDNEISGYYYGVSLRDSELGNNSLYNNSSYLSGNTGGQVLKSKNEKNHNINVVNAIYNDNQRVTEVYKANQANKIIHAYRRYIAIKYLKKEKSNNNDNGLNNDEIDNKVIDPNKSICNLPSLITVTKTSKTILSPNGNFGVRHYINKAVYKGQFLSDKCTGYGIYTTCTNDIIEGEFFSDALNGYCTISRKEGARYEGEIRLNLLDGIGTESFSDGSKYSGAYKNNAKNGIGSYLWPNGSKYIGEFRDNMPNGTGIYTYYDGRTYKGEWKDGKMHGVGFFLWNDGKRYMGGYEDDKRTGFGIFQWKTPIRFYIGFWKNGRQFGFGKVVTSVKEKYCLWKDGKRERVFTAKEDFFNDMKRSFDGLYGQYEVFFKLGLEELIAIIVN